MFVFTFHFFNIQGKVKNVSNIKVSGKNYDFVKLNIILVTIKDVSRKYFVSNILISLVEEIRIYHIQLRMII